MLISYITIYLWKRFNYFNHRQSKSLKTIPIPLFSDQAIFGTPIIPPIEIPVFEPIRNPDNNGNNDFPSISTSSTLLLNTDQSNFGSSSSISNSNNNGGITSSSGINNDSNDISSYEPFVPFENIINNNNDNPIIMAESKNRNQKKIQRPFWLDIVQPRLRNTIISPSTTTLNIPSYHPFYWNDLNIKIEPNFFNFSDWKPPILKTIEMNNDNDEILMIPKPEQLKQQPRESRTMDFKPLIFDIQQPSSSHLNPIRIRNHSINDNVDMLPLENKILYNDEADDNDPSSSSTSDMKHEGKNEHYADKGHFKHGWKNVYHKEEWGEANKYHDIWRYKDWKNRYYNQKEQNSTNNAELLNNNNHNHNHNNNESDDDDDNTNEDADGN
uniref:GATA zinc finger domain-containing protein 15-like n=1 Tax=Dermatophagoides pteronyssinus TaxID=6956 RepID=A0A6P6YC13_DERPT|nr:GATA zinc finger domain-containing protein 15-like [Dermatophagoides pteronyssinus]